MKILIAEDDATSRLFLRASLEKHGHEVIEAEDGEVAWQMFRSNPVPLAIVDWMMPGMDGLEFCRAIRESKPEKYVYLIVLTVRKGKGDYVAGMDAGADDFITKPFDPEELGARLRAAQRILGLKEEVERLEGILPICSYCKKIRDDEDRWMEVERYVAQRTRSALSHSICPTCYKTKIEPELEDN